MSITTNITKRDLDGNLIRYNFDLDPFLGYDEGYDSLCPRMTNLEKAKSALKKVKTSPISKAKEAFNRLDFSSLEKKKGSTISRAAEALKQVNENPQGYPRTVYSMGRQVMSTSQVIGSGQYNPMIYNPQPMPPNG